MPLGQKYVASTLVAEWTPLGSTTPTVISAFGRDLGLDEDMEEADTTTYGEPNRTYAATIREFGANMEVLLEDGYVIEDLLFSGAKGTLDIYPNGKTAGKKKISGPFFVGSRPRQYPYSDVAMMTVSWRPRGGVVETLVA